MTVQRPLPAAYAKPVTEVPPPARRASLRQRHWGVLVSFLLLVALPTMVIGAYLWGRAADQYASTLGFSIRKEENSSAVQLLGGITELSGSSTSDTDILYDYLQSQELVRTIDAKLDLRAIWSRPAQDPIFAFDTNGTIEDLLFHWRRMVRISHDTSTGLMSVRVLAFDPDDAQRIARAIQVQSSQMINRLSDSAREDAIRFARADLAEAEERLRSARAGLTAFRNTNQIVDPTMDTQGQMGLVGMLQEQLAQALIDADLLRTNTRAGDPRIANAEAKIRIIRDRIRDERNKLGAGSDGQAFATLVGEYERLIVEREFAEQAYTAALAAFDTARSQALRQSRYLAAHIAPTFAQRPEYPQRMVILALSALFLSLVWSVLGLLGYSLRDRR